MTFPVPGVDYEIADARQGMYQGPMYGRSDVSRNELEMAMKRQAVGMDGSPLAQAVGLCKANMDGLSVAIDRLSDRLAPLMSPRPMATEGPTGARVPASDFVTGLNGFGDRIATQRERIEYLLASLDC